MIGFLAGLLTETGRHIKYGLRIMLRQGMLCTAFLGALILLQQKLSIVPVWALFLLYIVFLVLQTLMLVALMRGMLFEYMREHFVATLKWQTYHTNFLYDSLYFLGVGALILFSAEGIILALDTYGEIQSLINEQRQDEVAQQGHMRESFALLMHSGILVALGFSGFLFFALMLIWARNIILMPASALGYRIRREEVRTIMHGHVFPIALLTMLVNLTIAGAAVGLYDLLLKAMPIQYATTSIVAVTYWLAIYLNAAFSSTVFSVFTADLQLQKDFKGF